MRTAIKASWVVGHDKGAHTLLRDGMVVYDGNRIIHVGQAFDFEAELRVVIAQKCREQVPPELVERVRKALGQE